MNENGADNIMTKDFFETIKSHYLLMDGAMGINCASLICKIIEKM